MRFIVSTMLDDMSAIISVYDPVKNSLSNEDAQILETITQFREKLSNQLNEPQKKKGITSINKFI